MEQAKVFHTSRYDLKNIDVQETQSRYHIETWEWDRNSYWTKNELTQCRNWSQRTAEGNHCPKNMVLWDRGFWPFNILLPLREQVCISSTKEIPSRIHNSLSPGLNEYPSATVQTDSPLRSLKQKSTHNKFTQSISEKRCSQTPLAATHALGIVTNRITAQKSRKPGENKVGGQSLRALSSQNWNCFSTSSYTFLPNNASQIDLRVVLLFCEWLAP